MALLKLDPFALTDVGRRRDHNEDFLGDIIFSSGRKYGPEKLKEKGYLFAVADGMGGHAAGEVASEMAVTTLFERYYNGPSEGDLGADLRQSVLEANLQVHQAGMSNGRGQMGTTLTLALIYGNRVVVGNVGDSRTYLIRQGLSYRVTHDHSLVQDQIDMGVLTPEQAEHSMIRNVITRAVGHREEVEPDFFERELETNDILLLCSDGLHGPVREEELGPIVTTSASLAEAGKKLVDLANERGGADNISVLLVAISEVGDKIPPILKNPTTYNQRVAQNETERFAVPFEETVTERFSNNSNHHGEDVTDRSEITKMIDLSQQATVPNSIPVKPVEPIPPTPILEKPESSPEIIEPVKRKKGRGLFFIILIALLLALLAGASYFLFFNSPTPAVAPAPTQTVPSPIINSPAAIITSPSPALTQVPTVTKSGLSNGEAPGIKEEAISQSLRGSKAFNSNLEDQTLAGYFSGLT